MDKVLLKETLDELVERFNTPDFVVDDPISIPHRYSRREDREIAGFLAATIAWGNRKAIVKSAQRIVALMDDKPYDFVTGASASELMNLCNFVHRTFNGVDLHTFITALRNIYANHNGIGGFFEQRFSETNDIRVVMADFRELFFALEHPQRSEKHLSSIHKGAACKRLCMYIKWMVRNDGKGVDFGIWKSIPASAIYMPLDVHSSNIGRQFGLLERRQNDWKAVEELTASLRELDSLDPVKYDFALFGAGINKVF